MEEYDIEDMRAKAKLARELYYKSHARCPDCKATRSTTQTYMGYIMVIGREEDYKDENRSECRCGWKGIVHDMLPE
jgi:hypothetical protein